MSIISLLSFSSPRGLQWQMFIASSIPVSTRRRFNVHTTFITLKRRRKDVETTSCAYWDKAPQIVIIVIIGMNGVSMVIHTVYIIFIIFRRYSVSHFTENTKYSWKTTYWRLTSNVNVLSSRS